MRLCLFARDNDPIADVLARIAADRGHDVLRVHFGALAEGAPTAFDGEAWLFQGEEIQSCDAFVLRQYPAPTALLGPPETVDTAEGFWRKGMLQKERSSFAQSCIMDVELQGKPIVNPLLATQPYDHKPLQLAVFQRAGLPIPRTLITNFPDAVKAFEADVGEVIFKPTAGGAETGVLDDESRAALARIRPSPVIFQERVRGDDVRVTIVGDRVVSSVVIPSETVDYRSGAAYKAGSIEYAPHPLPRRVEEMCLVAAKSCHHVLSGVDLKRRGDDDYVFIEANSAPVYLDIERKTGAPISEEIVSWLERAASSRRS